MCEWCFYCRGLYFMTASIKSALSVRCFNTGCMMAGPKQRSLISEEKGLRKRENWTRRAQSTSSRVQQRLSQSSGCVDPLASGDQHLRGEKEEKKFTTLSKCCASVSADSAGFYVDSDASDNLLNLEASSSKAVHERGKLNVQKSSRVRRASEARGIYNKEVVDDMPTSGETHVATLVSRAVPQSAKSNQVSTASKVTNINDKELLEDKPTSDETDVAQVVSKAVQPSAKLDHVSTASKVRNVNDKEVLEDEPTSDEIDVAKTVVSGAVQRSARAVYRNVHGPQPWFTGTARQIYIEITPTIRKFLEQQANDEAKRCARRRGINLDFLMQIVDVYNKRRVNGARIKMDELVEGTYIIGKSPPTCSDIQSLPISDRLRIQSEERKYKATMRDLFGSRDEDVFSNYTQAAALGVNALLGVFVMFLAGYWVAEYSGVYDFTTKCIVGIICSFGCLIVEAMLLLLHDEMLQRKKRRQVQPRS